MKFFTTILSLLIATTLLSQNKAEFFNGVAAMERNEYRIAETHLSLALEKNKHTEATLYYRGITYFHLGDSKKSIEDLAGIKEFKDAELWLAKSYINEKNYTEATIHIKNYIRLNGKDKVRKILTDIDFSPLLQTEEWHIYIEQLTFSEQENDLKDIQYHISKGNITIARSILDKYQNEDLTGEMHFLSALVYEKEMLRELAVYEARNAIDLEPGNLEYKIMLGNLLLDTEQPKKAILIFQDIIDMQPETFVVYPKLAAAHTLQREFEEAEKQIEFYLSYFPGDEKATEQASEIYRLSGNYTEALRQINKLFNTGKVKANWYLTRGEIYFQTGSYKFSSEDLSMYLDLDPTNQRANFQLGNAHHQLRNNQLACYFWQRAYKYGNMEAFEQLQKFCD